MLKGTRWEGLGWFLKYYLVRYGTTHVRDR